MIYTLKEILQRDTTSSIFNFINDQLSTLLGYTLEKNKTYELSCTTYSFVNIDDKLNVLGIIIITCKSFLFDEKVFFIEALSSKDNSQIVEQSLLMKGINYVFNLSNDSKIMSFITDDRIQTDVLSPFGFIHSQGVMVKL
uniref:Uncharacterized protein n=1 Tax=viral metagenome TaxID=1070528 RepID=A0A6C0KXF5_9ZZZZ